MVVPLTGAVVLRPAFVRNLFRGVGLQPLGFKKPGPALVAPQIASGPQVGLLDQNPGFAAQLQNLLYP